MVWRFHHLSSSRETIVFRTRWDAAFAKYGFKQPAVSEARRRRRQSYLRHGGHAIFFLQTIQFSLAEAMKCHFYNAIVTV
jgi:hypothetical protein